MGGGGQARPRTECQKIEKGDWDHGLGSMFDSFGTDEINLRSGKSWGEAQA